MGNVAFGVTGVWNSELYPVHLRATAVSIFYMGGRGLGSIAPGIVPLAAAHFGGSLLNGMVVVALPAAVVFIAASLLLPETLGRDLPAKGSGRASRRKRQWWRLMRPRCRAPEAW
jgi:hypothetical protein